MEAASNNGERQRARPRSPSRRREVAIWEELSVSGGVARGAEGSQTKRVARGGAVAKGDTTPNRARGRTLTRKGAAAEASDRFIHRRRALRCAEPPSRSGEVVRMPLTEHAKARPR